MKILQTYVSPTRYSAKTISERGMFTIVHTYIYIYITLYIIYCITYFYFDQVLSYNNTFENFVSYLFSTKKYAEKISRWVPRFPVCIILEPLPSPSYKYEIKNGSITWQYSVFLAWNYFFFFWWRNLTVSETAAMIFRSKILTNDGSASTKFIQVRVKRVHADSSEWKTFHHPLCACLQQNLF